MNKLQKQQIEWAILQLLCIIVLFSIGATTLVGINFAVLGIHTAVFFAVADSKPKAIKPMVFKPEWNNGADWNDPDYIAMVHKTIEMEKEAFGEVKTLCECSHCDWKRKKAVREIEKKVSPPRPLPPKGSAGVSIDHDTWIKRVGLNNYSKFNQVPRIMPDHLDVLRRKASRRRPGTERYITLRFQRGDMTYKEYKRELTRISGKW